MAVYCEDIDNVDRCVENEECCIYMSSEAPTIYVLHINNGTYYNSIEFIKHAKALDDAVEKLERGLRGLKVEDLKKLYTHISNSLEERKCYVADFNVLLTSLMGCNSNSLFLGSRE